MQQLAKKLSQQIEKLGGVTSKTSSNLIIFARNYPFAKITVKKDKLELDFTTPSRIKHSRLQHIKQLKANKFSHKIAIAKEADIDAQVSGWLLIAHATN